MKSVLITGCSSGIGYLTALKFARQGWAVYAGVRKKTSYVLELDKLAKKEKLTLQTVIIDVTKEEQIKKVVGEISHKGNNIDLLINNAGFGSIGPVEEFTIEEIKALYDVNIFGAVRMMKEVIPVMRKYEKGRIINISSINGLLSFGLYGAYSSSKFALESLSEAMRFELAPFGIDVVLIEPGAFETKFAENSKKPAGYLRKNSPYKSLGDPLNRVTVNKLRKYSILRSLTDPQKVADKVYKVATIQNPSMRYTVGLDATLYLIARKLLPYWLWLKLLRKAYKW